VSNTNPDSLCACAALRRAARAVTQLYDLVFAPCSLKATEFISLKIIHDADEIAQCDIAREHAIAVETLSRRLGSLRKKRLIESHIGVGRERIYRLTEEGERIFDEALPYWQRAQARLRQSLGNSEWDAVFKVAHRTVEAARSAEQLRTSNSPTFSKGVTVVSHYPRSPR
jgi:DNA-binding MarR family transcriptional regulator